MIERTYWNLGWLSKMLPDGCSTTHRQPLAGATISGSAILDASKFPTRTKSYPSLAIEDVPPRGMAWPAWMTIYTIPIYGQTFLDWKFNCTYLDTTSSFESLKWRCSNPAILLIKPSCILVKLLQHFPKRQRAPGLQFQTSFMDILS